MIHSPPLGNRTPTPVQTHPPVEQPLPPTATDPHPVMTRPGTGSWSGHRRSFPAATRRQILDRDHHACQLHYPGCTGTATEADHIVPHAEGGTDHPDNGQAVCPTCHTTKTRREQARGRARRPTRRRPEPPHPGLIDPPPTPGG